MFLITNRDVNEKKKGPDALGSKPNEKGPNELRLAEATRKGGRWKVSVLPDTCTRAMLKSAGIKPSKDAAGKDKSVWSSRYVAYKLLLQLRARQKRSGKAPALAFFVHGYNNDVEAVLERAKAFEDHYGVEVIAFTWPANGGGLGGTMSYLSDKRDALASVGAFDRAILKLDEYLKEMNQERVERIEGKATRDHGDDAEGWDGHFTREMVRECPFTLNLLLHSMGNYIFKHFMSSSTFCGNRLVFDNVVMAAADANNAGHVDWVDRIQCRNRVYITINENDIALRASRMKAGEEQKARLGHWPYGLESKRAVYVNFTDARGVGDSHAYFEGDPIKKNANVRQFFDAALNGAVAERDLDYDIARNMFRVK
ncbi:MAG: alpha/beta hydrolase [Gammaproteobacteria bacterium]|nr:alpha/beta hydrolase [Gammaproteobacteria bacterium]MDH3410947.1 alpha/beta hydrolase [Gammaproteobacteria bacterium]